MKRCVISPVNKNKRKNKKEMLLKKKCQENEFLK